MKPIWLIGVALATIMVGPGPELVGVWAEDSDGTVLIARSPEAEKSQAKDAESPAAKSDEGAKPPPKPVEAEPKKPVTSLILTVKLALMADPR
ncbi:MAG: hypothetical protein ACT4OO_15170, partial [Nitrospiraceae bacterium]